MNEMQTHPTAADSQQTKLTSKQTDNQPPHPTSRRGFLRAAGVGAAALTANALFPGSLVQQAAAVEIGPPEDDPIGRGNQLQQIRNAAAAAARQEAINSFPHPTNGDEEHYAADQFFAGMFSKTLPHDANTGLVDPVAYQALLTALEAGTVAAFDSVPSGDPSGNGGRLAGPVSPLVFQIEGPDSVAIASPFIPPSISSAAAAAEMVELYWEAYLRDVPFIDYADSHPLISQAILDLNKLSSYAGPTPINAQNLFRYGSFPSRPGLPGLPNPNAFFGATAGPYVSQILFQQHLFDGATYTPMIRTHAQVSDPNTGHVLPPQDSPGVDFLTNVPEYVQVENGQGALSPNVFDTQHRFVRSVRDVGALANSDSIFSLYFRAAIILAGLGVPLQPNPYTNAIRSSGFSTFSTAWLFGLVGNVHKAEAHAFYQKWYVHRKLRPEAFGNLVDGVKRNRFNFTLTPALNSELMDSAVLPLIFTYNQEVNQKRMLPNTNGTFLLPQETNGGSPSHPDPPAGHAFTAGACVTLLKAVFDMTDATQADGRRRWPVQPVVAAADGLSLVNVTADLTVLGELNKLAANISEGRNMLGIHSRVGGNLHGMIMGENVAIDVLNEAAATFPEQFGGFSLTKFDGETITVG